MISAIEPRKGYKNRRDVFVDEEYAFSADERTLRELHIAPGLEAQMEEIAALIEEKELSSALERSYSFLEARMRSAKEIEENLRKAGYAQSVASQALERLKEIGLAHDEVFARLLAESRLKSKSMRAVLRELKSKGIAREVIEEIGSEKNEREEIEKCAAIAAKYLKRRDDPRVEQRKAAQACMRRGYDWETIKIAMALLKEEIDNTAE